MAVKIRVPGALRQLTRGAAMLVNFLWPRATSNPPLNSLPNYPDWLGSVANVPIFEATIGVILLVGVVYYLIAQARKPTAAAQAA